MEHEPIPSFDERRIVAIWAHLKSSNVWKDQDASLDGARRFEIAHPCLRSSTIVAAIRFRS
jgi:hypothetical protein